MPFIIQCQKSNRYNHGTKRSSTVRIPIFDLIARHVSIKLNEDISITHVNNWHRSCKLYALLSALNAEELIDCLCATPSESLNMLFEHFERNWQFIWERHDNGSAAQTFDGIFQLQEISLNTTGNRKSCRCSYLTSRSSAPSFKMVK